MEKKSQRLRETGTSRQVESCLHSSDSIVRVYHTFPRPWRSGSRPAFPAGRSPETRGASAEGVDLHVDHGGGAVVREGKKEK